MEIVQTESQTTPRETLEFVPETSTIDIQPVVQTDRKELFIEYIKSFILVKYIILMKKYPGFRYLWFGFLISFFGDFFSLIACVQILNNYIPNYASTGVGAFLLIKNLPSTFVSPLAGVLADRFDRRKIMLIFDLIRAVIVLNNIWVKSTDRVWIIYVVGAIQSTCTGLFDPSRAAVMPNTIEDPEDLITANALSGSTWSIAAAIASGVGGLVVSVFGTDVNFVLDAVTYLVSSVCILQLFRLGISGSKKEKIEQLTGSLDLKEPLPVAEEQIEENIQPIENNLEEENATFLKEELKSNTPSLCKRTIGVMMKPLNMIVELIQFFRNDLDLLWIAMIRGFVASIFGGLGVCHIQYIETEAIIFNSASLTFGIYYSGIGLACFIGPMVAQKYCDKKPRGMRIWIVIGFFIGAIGSILSSFSFNFIWMLIFGAILRPFGESIVYMLSVTVMQRTVPDHVRGRVFSFSGGFFTFTFSISSLLGGLLKDLTNLSLHSVMYIFSIWSAIIFAIYFVYILIYLILHSKRIVSTEWPDFKN